jgi:hypothetical protein
MACIPAVGLVLAGCATSVPPRPQGVFVGNQGDAWELVLPGPRIADASAWGVGSEYSRRDAALGVRHPTAVSAIDAWPRPDRPDLDRTRRITIDLGSGNVLYYRRHRDR